MNKKILIIGSTLYSLCLAYHLSKKSKNLITIANNRNKILGSFDHIKIKKFKLNNGFHAIDLPRCNELLNFLKSINLKVKIKKKINKILVNKNILNLYETIDYWPENIKKDFKKRFKIPNNYSFNQIIKGKLLSIFNSCSKRYSENHNDCKHLFVPWFLPKEFNIKDKDEGALFRSKIKNKNLLSYYAIPKNNLFSSFQKIFKVFLKKKKNINIFHNVEIDYKNQNLKTKYKIINFKKFDKIYYGDSFLTLIPKSKPDHLKKIVRNKRFFYNMLISVNKNLKFSEMICLNKKIYFLNRISIFKSLKNSTILQLEILHKKVNLKKNEIINILKELQNIFKLIVKPKLIAYRNTRIIYTPSQKWKNEGKKIIIKWCKKNKIPMKINFEYDGAINMSKSWIFSLEDSKKINE